MNRSQYTTEQLVKALRCTCSVYRDADRDCAGCPFVIQERLGDDNWLSCAVDCIGLLAADRLEELDRENNT